MKNQGLKLSVEAYAKERHRYHPIIPKVFLKLYNRYPMFFSDLFQCKLDLNLFFKALKYVKINVLKTHSISSGRRAPGKRKEPAIEFFHRFPKEFLRFFRGRYPDAIDFLKKLKIWRSTRINQEKKNEKMARKESDKRDAKMSSTPCFMLANHAIWASDILNKPGRHLGNTFDLTTVEGFVYLLHEVFHSMQWFRSPLKLLFQYIKAIVRSLSLSENHIFWAHELIDFEVEAIIFHQKLWMFLEDDKDETKKEILKEFKKYQ